MQRMAQTVCPRNAIPDGETPLEMKEKVRGRNSGARMLPLLHMMNTLTCLDLIG